MARKSLISIVEGKCSWLQMAASGSTKIVYSNVHYNTILKISSKFLPKNIEDCHEDYRILYGFGGDNFQKNLSRAEIITPKKKTGTKKKLGKFVETRPKFFLAREHFFWREQNQMSRCNFNEFTN